MSFKILATTIGLVLAGGSTVSILTPNEDDDSQDAHFKRSLKRELGHKKEDRGLFESISYFFSSNIGDAINNFVSSYFGQIISPEVIMFIVLFISTLILGFIWL